MGMVSRDIAFLDEEIAAAREALENITFDLDGETIRVFDDIKFSSRDAAIPDNASNVKPFKGNRKEETNKKSRYNSYVTEIVVTCNDKDFGDGGIFDPKSLSNTSQQSNIANNEEKWRIADILRGGSRNKTPAKPRKKLFNSLDDVI